MEIAQAAGASLPGPDLGAGRVGGSILQRLGREVAPACASAVTVLGLVLLGVLAVGPVALGLGGLGIESLNAVAVATLVAGAESLWLLVSRKPRPIHKIAAFVLATLVLAVVVLRVLGLSGILSVSTLESVLPGATRGLLLPFLGITADAVLCFALLAFGLLTVDFASDRRYMPSQVLALALGILALFSFVTYGYNLIMVVRVGGLELMSLPVSAAFMVLAVGLLYARPQRGFAAIILSDTAGGESARWLLPVAVLVPVLLGAMRLEIERLGYVSTGAGTVLLVMSLILLLLAMIWWNSALLFSADMQRESIRRRLHHDSRHDALTGLANRPHFLQRLEHEAERARRHQVPCALLYMDLDGFKQVNDTLGHPAGDALLRVVAGRLKDCIRAGGDLCARLGGDEFVVILEDSPKARAYEVANRILAAVSAPITLDAQEAKVGVSIGMAFGDSRTESGETLLKAADVALYAAKHGGKGRVHPPADASSAPSSARRSSD